jgi:hypothetical protein
MFARQGVESRDKLEIEEAIIMKGILKWMNRLFIPVYVCLIFAQFYIEPLNQLDPYVLGMPMTIWWTLLWVVVANCFHFFMSKIYWESYDPEGDSSNDSPRKLH